MITIKLPNGTVIETQTPKEASETVHSIYWREFHGSVSTPKLEVAEVQEGKSCRICGKPLPVMKKRYCSVECADKGEIKSRKAYYHKNKDKLRQYVRAWVAKHSVPTV